MPPLLLDDDEAIAIAVGLRTAARASVTGIEETSVRALVKLEQVLPAHLRRRVRALGSATMTLPAAGRPSTRSRCSVLAAACRDSERVRFAYRGRDGAASRREVEPHSLVNLGRRWYLVAWDTRRRDWRTFRVDRLTGPASTGVRFPPRELPAEGPAAYVAQRLSAAPSRYEARVTLHAPAEAVRRDVPSALGDHRADRRRDLRVPHRRRRPRLARPAHRDVPRRLRRPRAARAARARVDAGGAVSPLCGSQRLLTLPPVGRPLPASTGLRRDGPARALAFRKGGE